MASLLLLFLISLVHAKRLPNIYWNSSNPIFDISNTDHVIPVEIDDRVSIYCPRPADDGYQYSYVYMVSEEEYTHCVLLKPHLLGSCNNNTREVSIGVVFRHYSPVPGGLEFKAGKTYYMISTSDGSYEGMDRKKGGLCLERQMKIKFEVQSKRGQLNPKFAARTLGREEQNSASSTPVMYIIHGSDDDAGEPDDDDGVATSSLALLSLLSISLFYLL